MSKLKEHYEMYKLRFYEKMTYADIAKQFGISSCVVRQHTIQVKMILEGAISDRVDGKDDYDSFRKEAKIRKLKAEIASCNTQREKNDAKQAKLEFTLRNLA